VLLQRALQNPYSHRRGGGSITDGVQYHDGKVEEKKQVLEMKLAGEVMEGPACDEGG
jgi:hypothetical protein